MSTRHMTSIKPTLYTAGISFTDAGFFVEPIEQDNAKFRSDPRKEAWLKAERVFQSAKRGDFSELPTLIDIFDVDDLGLSGVCYQLLAYAGTRTCFSRMRTVLPELDWEGQIDFCIAMAVGDTLSAVPLIAQTYVYLWEMGADGVEMIPHMLSHELEPALDRLGHPKFPDTGPVRDDYEKQTLHEYSQRVMSRHAELTQQFGSDEVHVDHGALFSVIALAKRLRRDIAVGDLHWIGPTRLHFEASTGVDCRGFYDNGAFKPLRAAAIVEEFLESPEAANFVPGVRYFFGHPIPD